MQVYQVCGVRMYNTQPHRYRMESTQRNAYHILSFSRISFCHYGRECAKKRKSPGRSEKDHPNKNALEQKMKCANILNIIGHYVYENMGNVIVVILSTHLPHIRIAYIVKCLEMPSSGNNRWTFCVLMCRKLIIY